MVAPPTTLYCRYIDLKPIFHNGSQNPKNAPVKGGFVTFPIKVHFEGYIQKEIRYKLEIKTMVKLDNLALQRCNLQILRVTVCHLRAYLSL